MKNIVLGIPSGDYETVGGYITNRIGRIPAQGENITLDNFNILIARANHVKVDLVKLINTTELEF